MKSLLKVASVSCALLLCAGLTGCSSGGGAGSAGSGAAAVGKNLYQQLGGADGVTRLANQFGANIASNPTLNTVLDAVAIGNVKAGLTNDIMRASGLTPTTATTMTSALEGKAIDATQMSALTDSLKEAGVAVGLDSATINTLASTVMQPASKNLLGM